MRCPSSSGLCPLSDTDTILFRMAALSELCVSISLPFPTPDLNSAYERYWNHANVTNEKVITDY